MGTRCRGLVALAAIAAAFSGAPATAPADVVSTHELTPGEPLFIDGPPGFDEPVLLPSEARALLCDAGLATCLDYRLVVPPGGERLRVALDSNGDIDLAEGEQFGMQLFDPDGREVDSVHSVPDVYHSAELFAEDPAPGTWTARVVPVAAHDAPLRLRVKLEGPPADPEPDPSAGGDPTELLPNLRMTPPFEFTLQTPAVLGSYGFLGLDFAPLRGVTPTRGCLPVELLSYAARRCLRYSAGPENVGPGRLVLEFVPPDGLPLAGPSVQRIDRSDGSTVERPAGDYEYHLVHTHFHHRAFGDSDLLRVVDPASGQLEPAGEGPKVGACMGDLRIVNWEAFDNQPEEEAESTCGPAVANDPTTEGQTGLSRGWADIYYYSQEGQYVEFGDNADGLYVLRVRANDGDVIHETTTGDNVSYALVEIRGDDVSVLERGYGRDPWDPQKEVVADGRVDLTADE